MLNVQNKKLSKKIKPTNWILLGLVVLTALGLALAKIYGWAALTEPLLELLDFLIDSLTAASIFLTV